MSEQSKAELWNGALSYLEKSRAAWWNDDYMEFLIEKVWKLQRPVSVVDFGCGIGFLGELLLPHLPKGSSYTGIDVGDKLLLRAEEIFRETDYETAFLQADLCEFIPERKYDVAICQTVLQHIPDPIAILKKMKDSVKEGGLVISIDASRNTTAAASYIEGVDTAEMGTLGIEQKLRYNILHSTQKDFEIGLKTPVYLQKIGLKNIGVRMNDYIQFMNPGSADYQSQYQAFSSGLSELTEEMKYGFVESMLAKGLTIEDAERLFISQQKTVSYVLQQRETLSAVSGMCLFISFGTV